MSLRRRALARTLTGVVAIATAAGTLVTTPASAATTMSVDFENGSWAPLVVSGDPTLTVENIDGDAALHVANRTGNYVGVQTPAGLVTPGTTYTVSVDFKLGTGVAATQARLVVKPDYTWIGNSPVTADAWTTLKGTWTAPSDGTGLQIYVGTNDLSPAATYDYYLDNFTITTEATTPSTTAPGGATNPTPTPASQAQGTGNVAALTFDDGPNPGETESLLDVLKAQDIKATFCVIGQNIQAPGGADTLKRIVGEGHTLCNHTTSYADMGSWTADQVRADLIANLDIIRKALGNPNQAVPYFRAPNGSWGVTAPVAVELGMQPLGLGNVIQDWTNPQDSTDVLATRLRSAIQPGAIVLGHDGGGDRNNTVAAFAKVLPEYSAWTFTLPQQGGGSTTPATDPGLSNDFETELAPWGARGSGEATATLSTEAHTGAQSALVAGRTNAWNGLSAPITGVLESGASYELSAWVKLPAGTDGTADVRVSVQRAVDDSVADKWITLTTATGVTAGEWTHIALTFSAPADPELLYFETATGTADFLVDDIVVNAPSGSVQDLQSMKETVPFPLGVAIDDRETTGAASDLVVRHFNQITPENHMKPEAWYDASHTFRTPAQADILMDYADANDMRVYGHVLVWYSQTPDWFFQAADGTALTASAADQQLMKDRMRTHIFGVAKALSDEHGLFGSETNQLVAFDVVNEVVSDDRTDDGLRRSEWYRILGEDFIDLAFAYADEAFNETYAAPGTNRPITLFINDYNTEQSGKQDRYHALVARLLSRGVPVDGVGHQFHVSLSTPTSTLAAAIDRFADLPVVQAVTELDVTVGTPVTQAKLVEQGHYYQDVFQILRDRSEDIFSATIWGLTDSRSWRDEQAPLVFTGSLQAKPAYYGVVGSDELPGIIRTAITFVGDAPLTTASFDDTMWDALPLLPIGGSGFQLRWTPDHLTAYVKVVDGDVEATDAVSFTVGTSTVMIPRKGAANAVVREVEGGYEVLAHLPLTAAEGDQVHFDARVTDGSVTTGWNSAGETGTLTLAEALSMTTVPETATAPTIDGTVDDVWSAATSITTDKVLSGDAGAAKTTVRTLWKGNTLYLLADVTDETIDLTASDPWNQDSVEFFLNPDNTKAPAYGPGDTQIRINADNKVSFGTGDETAQAKRLTSTTTRTAPGYIVEAAVVIETDAQTAGAVHGLDVQVNDGTAGARTGVTSWGDPTGLGYQSTAHWGSAILTAAKAAPSPTASATPTVTASPSPSATAKPTMKPSATALPSAVPTAKPGRDLYTTPGFHVVNGRHWYTACEPYSQTIRCRTDIWASQMVVQDGRLVNHTGWVFNNLTYLPLMTRAQWGTNPLARTGTWTSSGTTWRTECDTATTGANTCRSYLWRSYLAGQKAADGTWQAAPVTGWVLNNITKLRVA